MKQQARNGSAIVRILQIGGVLASLFLFHRFNSHRKEGLGIRIRLACEKLGLTFIKIGQILSTRYDLLGREDCEELQKLLDAVPPFPRTEVERLFREDFGRLPEDCFEEFDWTPIASASVSQVYQARLRGQKVAVKIRRPGVARNLRADARIFMALAYASRMFSKKLRRVDLAEIARQARSWMEVETNFLNEADNIESVSSYYSQEVRERIGKHAQAIVFPMPHREFCSRNILTMDFLEGVLAKDFRSTQGDPRYDAQASLYNLVRAVFRSCLTESEFYFHGDPHPSNILIMENGQVGLLDLGLLGRLGKSDMELVRDLLLAVYIRDTDRTANLILDFCRVPHERYFYLIRQELPEYFRTVRESGLGFLFTGIVDIGIKHKIPLPYDFVLFGRMQTVIDGLFKTVVPGQTTLDILGEELDIALRRRTFDNLRNLELLPALYALTEGLRKAPDKLPRLIERYVDDPLQLVRDVSAAVRGERSGV